MRSLLKRSVSAYPARPRSLDVEKQSTIENDHDETSTLKTPMGIHRYGSVNDLHHLFSFSSTGDEHPLIRTDSFDSDGDAIEDGFVANKIVRNPSSSPNHDRIRDIDRHPHSAIPQEENVSLHSYSPQRRASSPARVNIEHEDGNGSITTHVDFSIPEEGHVPNHSHRGGGNVPYHAMHQHPHPLANTYSSGHPYSNDGGGVEEQLDEGPLHFRVAYVDAIKTQFFYLGLSSGASLQMFAVSVILMFVSYSHDAGPINELSHEYYPVFRCCFFISFFFSLYGANLFIWRRAKIDYASVLGVSYAHTYQYVLRGSTSVAYIVFSMFMLYVLTLTGGLETLGVSKLKHLWPMLAVLLPLLIFFCPFDRLTHACFGVRRNGFKQRINLFGQILAVLCAPFTESTFLRSFIADIFCSMPKIFTDLQYTLCIYSTGSWDMPANLQGKDVWVADNGHLHAYGTCGAGSRLYFSVQLVLAFFPYYLRLMQSGRAYVDTRKTKHLFNMLKYASSLVVTALATARSLQRLGPGPSHDAASAPSTHMYFSIDAAWFAAGVCATLYSWFWDVVMDWGLGDWRARYPLLRPTLLFAPHFYYWAIFLDGIMRLGWVIYISPGQIFVQQHVVLLLGCVELIRRFMWAIFRVEWEHLTKLAAHSHSHEKMGHPPPAPSSVVVSLGARNGNVEVSGGSVKVSGGGKRVVAGTDEDGDVMRFWTSTVSTSVKLKGGGGDDDGDDDEEEDVHPVSVSADIAKFARPQAPARAPTRSISEFVREFE